MDHQETEEKAEKPRKKRRWILLIFKIIFFAAAFILVMLTVLANLGGSSDTLKTSIEGFISENTGRRAHVGKLNSMTFFPNISFDFVETEIYGQDGQTPVIYLGHVQVAFGFWDVMAATGKIKAFNIEEVRVVPGVLLNQSVDIKNLTIVDSGDGARLEAKGMIGAASTDLTAGINVHGAGRHKKYSFSSEHDFTFSLADTKMNGKMRKGETGGIVLENLDIAHAGNKVASGRLVLARSGGYFNISGQLAMEQHHSDLDLDLRLASKPTGNLRSREFHIDDFTGASAYGQMMASLEKIFEILDDARESDIKLNAAALYKNKIGKGTYNGPLPLKAWHIDAAALAKK